MKFKIDENLPVEVTAVLGQAGHDAVNRLVPLLKAEPLMGHLWMVDEVRVRVR